MNKELEKKEAEKTEIPKKATFQDFLAKKVKTEENKNATIDAFVPSMDRTITLVKPSEERLYTYADELGSNANLKTIVETNRKLIYDCCSELQNPELHEALEVKDPYDVPRILFEINEVKEIMNQFNRILNSTKIEEKIKNS